MKKVPTIILLLTISLFLNAGLIHAQSDETAVDASAAEPKIPQTIVLKDGTVLKGHLSDVTDNHYVISTANLGQVRVLAEEVTSITTGQAAAPQPSADSTQLQLPSGFGNILGGQPQMNGHLAQMQQSIMSDPQMMAEIQALMGDEQIMNMLQNPSVMQDILSMDPNTIQNNTEIQTLMQNPKMQGLLNKMMQKTGAPQGAASGPMLLDPAIP